MRGLLELLDHRDIDAYGTAYPNGTVQLTLKGPPPLVDDILARWGEALMVAESEESAP